MGKLVTPEEFFALSDERDQQEHHRLAEVREAYRAGYRNGLEAARIATGREWSESNTRHVLSLGPSFEELERRRWGDGGRAAAMIDRPE